MKILGIDFGDARTGIAVCDQSEFMASPVTVIKETDFDTVVKKSGEYAKNLKVEKIVVGFPKNMDGSIGERAQKCETFAKQLEELTGIKVDLYDERCTTMAAAVYMNATDTHGKKRKATIDAAAATIILQDYLDYNKNKKMI